ncbi:MAG: hypothetical protein Q9163_005521 [Psora crenata]
MAEENLHKQEIILRSLSTNSVTLYPTRAQVVRDINDISLKPGSNEITIYGLTPSADESSIKVDGKGSATITDMMVELVDNRDRYEDVYPSDSEEEEGEDESSEESDSDIEKEDIKALEEEDERISQAIKHANEDKASASGRLTILETYGKSVELNRPEDIQELLRQYSLEREKAYADFSASEQKAKNLAKERQKITKRKQRTIANAILNAKKEKAKANKAKAKEKEKKQRAKEDKLQDKRQLKADRERFWPKKVYRVVVSLDTNSDLTPSSSRRGSVSSVAKIPTGSTASDACQVSLSICYITSCASWSPRYDLSLNTPTGSGTIVYRAEFSNRTSETWTDAKVILSTSQTAFQGLWEPIPTIQPWHIRLAKDVDDFDSSTGALNSNYELQYKYNNQAANYKQPMQPRGLLFGLEQSKPSMQSGAIQQQQQQQVMAQQNRNGHNDNLFKNLQAQPRGFFGSSNANNSVAVPEPNVAPPPPGTVSRDRYAVSGGAAVEYPDEDESDLALGERTLVPDLPSLTTQESSWSKSGLTATYDIPGLRTIIPSHTTRRHRIASIHLKDVHFSYLAVPKLRAAAFLKARLRNTSSVTLLSGPTGLTLDGSFLGNSYLPRCSVGESFSLSLGVDPSVSVLYGKPVVRRSRSGIITKEGSAIYTRTCTVTNTKADRAVEGLVLDQVPVSEDDRLKVEILHPRGLRQQGDSVRSGVGSNITGKDDPKWGKASATLKKGGEVCFDFKIEASKRARFVLEYEARYPSGDTIVGV